MKSNPSHSQNLQPNPDVRPASKRTADAPWLYGTIRGVERSRELLFVHLPAGQDDKIVHWVPQTRFLDQGAQVNADALREGQQVFVQYANEGGQKVATEIDIVVKPVPLDSIAA